MTVPDEVDIIVCGGGSCGCVVAGRSVTRLSIYIFPSRDRGLCYNRLANLDHKLQVLLIEGGESNLNNPWVYRPGICESALHKKISLVLTGLRPSEHEAGQQDCFILLFETIQMAGRSQGSGAVCTHPRRRQLDQLHDVYQSQCFGLR